MAGQGNQGRKRRTERISRSSIPLRVLSRHVTRLFRTSHPGNGNNLGGEGGLFGSRHRARGHIYETTGKPVEIKDPSCKGKQTQLERRNPREPAIRACRDPRAWSLTSPQAHDCIRPCPARARARAHTHIDTLGCKPRGSSGREVSLCRRCASRPFPTSDTAGKESRFPPRYHRHVSCSPFPRLARPKRDPWGRRGSSYQTVSRRLRVLLSPE